MNLFDYPNSPGFKEPTTSRDAAQSMAKAAPKMREKVKAAFRRYGPATADQIADQLRLSVLSVRPRVAELARMGVIEDTGDRRLNDSGRGAKVWRLAA